MEQPQQRRLIILASISTAIFFLLLGGLWALYTYTTLPFSKNHTQDTPTSRGPARIVDLSKPEVELAPGKRYFLQESKVSPVYAAIYSAVMREMRALQYGYTSELGPLFDETRVLAEKKDYAGLYTIGKKVESLNAAQKNRLAVLSADLKNLAEVTDKLSDKETVRLTNDFIAKGTKLIAVYTTLSTSIDELLAGDGNAEEMASILLAIKPVYTDFALCAEELIAHFSNTK